MLKNILFVVSALAIARAQIPSLGWCPEYVPMTNFDMGKFLGVWYEAERYFQLLDPASRCVTANYTKTADGKFRVSNEVTNRFTGIKRVLDGEIKAPASKAEEGKLHVKYTALPLTPETQYAVLETDYKSYAVLWSCSGIGPLNAQSAWLMTRSRRPEGAVMQKAYGVLDKYKISKTFFVKTNQEDCSWFEEAPKPAETATSEAPAADAPAAEEPVVEQGEKSSNFRSAITLADEPSEDKKSEEKKEEKIDEQGLKNAEVSEESEKESNLVEKSAEPAAPITVPEVILKAADRAKDAIDAIGATFEKPVENLQQALEKPIDKIQETFEKPIEQIKETFQKPYEQIKETLQKPIDKIKEALTPVSSETKEKSVPSEEKPQAEPAVEQKLEKTES